jgi:hypothetical protein
MARRDADWLNAETIIGYTASWNQGVDNRRSWAP